MRIAILADPIDNQNAGVHIYTWHMVEAVLCTNTKHEFILITSKPHPEIEGAQNIVVPSSPFPGYRTFRLFLAIPWLLRRMKVDCVLEPAHIGPFNLPASVHRLTVIHDLTMIIFPHYHRLISQWLQRLFLPRVLKKATVIITDSKATARDVETHFPSSSGRTVVNHLGTEARFRPVQSSSILERYSITSPYFLCVGTVEPRKNLVFLLDAYERFRKSNEQICQLVIVGPEGWKTGPFHVRLASHAYRQDIICTGYIDRDDLPPLYTMAEAFIYPSLYEGFGLPVVEAMRCGSPCILSQTSSLPEAGGEAALYFDPHNIDGLLEHMETIIGDKTLRNTLRERSFKQAEQFTWKRHAIRLHQLFDQLGKNT